MESPVNVLIVDDTEANLIAFEGLLHKAGVTLLKARSGIEALEMLLVHEVALALVDVQMPKMDGFELAQLMRGTDRTRQIPLVFITAAPRDQQRLFEGYSLGAVDFLYKPIEPHILRSKVDVFVQLYRQKRQLADQLAAHRETLRLNELLTAAIGHDLRNPLNTVVGGAQIIRDKSTDEKTQLLAERIYAGGQRMAKLIDQLLDFSSSRIQGTLSIELTECNLLQLAERVAAEHRVADASAQVEIQHEGDLSGMWDEGRICQVLSNLIGNALAHGDRSEPVVVRLEGLPGEIFLMVANKGVIPPEVLPQIFDPFRSTGSRGSLSSGLGLGLYIVDQIVKIHGGRVNVSSDATEGTKFSIRLPKKPSLATRPATQSVSTY